METRQIARDTHLLVDIARLSPASRKIELMPAGWQARAAEKFGN